MDKRISILKDCLEINGSKIYPPFTLENMSAVLGEGRFAQVKTENGNDIDMQVWDEIGFFCWLKGEEEIDSFCVCIKNNDRNPTEKIFDGEVCIGKNNYREAKWKQDKYDITQEAKIGCFSVYTLLPGSEKDEKFPEVSELFMSRLEINYKPPKEKKPKKYIIKKLDEPVLYFKNFNFKLAVLQVLMYEKNLIEPKFDIHEFAEEKGIDIDEEGYEPIKKAVKWFKDLQIPTRLAPEVTRLTMDGGCAIYGQIEPYWDGEDDVFDLNSLDESEIVQFPNLKSVVLMSSKPEKVKALLKKYNIEVEML